jgi:hypothetical protein
MTDANAWFGKANANTDVVRTAVIAEAIIIDALLRIIIYNYHHIKDDLFSPQAPLLKFRVS